MRCDIQGDEYEQYFSGSGQGASSLLLHRSLADRIYTAALNSILTDRRRACDAGIEFEQDGFCREWKNAVAAAWATMIARAVWTVSASLSVSICRSHCCNSKSRNRLATRKQKNHKNCMQQNAHAKNENKANNTNKRKNKLNFPRELNCTLSLLLHLLLDRSQLVRLHLRFRLLLFEIL